MIENHQIEQGKRLREIRLALGMSRKEIASVFGVSENFYGTLETGRTMITNYYMFWLAIEHRVNLNWLADGTGTMFLEDSGNVILNHISEKSESQSQLDNGDKNDSDIAKLKEEIRLLKELVLLNMKN